MSETQKEIPVREFSKQQSERFANSAAELGDNLARLGASAMALPLAFLPRETRAEMRDATRDLIGAVARLHLGVAEAAIEAMNDLTHATAGEASRRPAPRDGEKRT